MRWVNMRKLSCTTAVIAVSWLWGCTEAPDVVASALSFDAGTVSDGSADAGADSGRDTHCDATERFRRARLPEQVVLDLYMMNCKIPLSDFMPGQSSTQLSAQEFSRLINAPMLEPMPGISTALLCDAMSGGYYVEPFDRPQRLVLCPSTCEVVKTEVARVLALDGCFASQAGDDAGAP